MSWLPEELHRWGSQQGHRAEVKARLDFTEGRILEEPLTFGPQDRLGELGAKLGDFSIREGFAPVLPGVPGHMP